MTGSLSALSGLECHGLDVSYFTGKVEGFLRYREIPHRRVELNTRRFRDIGRATGLAQMPAIRLPDGRWMSDSTPMIEWMDAQLPGPGVVPRDPLQRFVSQLLEDYADEWLWRPALHYRWSFAPDSRLMSQRIAAEMLTDVPLPLALRRWFILRRQIRHYVKGDGIVAANAAHVESIYTRNLAFLQPIFAARPFLLGALPTLADFGFFASMFRHFSLDPTPARIMRQTAPAVYEWVARLWSARASAMPAGAGLLQGVPPDWLPILRDFAACYLPYLNANAQAWRAGRRSFRVLIEGVEYQLPVHRYRVWCLERLQGIFTSLPEIVRAQAGAVLQQAGILPGLLAIENPASGFDVQRRAPFFDSATVWAARG